jgi:hypothetical protein
MAKEIITVTDQMAKMSGHKLGDSSKMRVRKQVYDLCTTVAQVASWIDVVVIALAFGDLSGHAWLEDVSFVYEALQDGQPSSDDMETDWDAATEERVLQLLKALNDAAELPVPSEPVLKVILKALFREGPCSIQALELLCHVKRWFIDSDLEHIMQEHNVWSRMGAIIIINNSWGLRYSVEGYIQLGHMLSSLIQWTPYIHSDPSQWIIIYFEIDGFNQVRLQTPYLSILERIYGVKYTGTYQFTDDTEKTLAQTLIALSNVWEGFTFSEQQTLQVFYQVIRCTISIAFKSRYLDNFYTDEVPNILISPNFRATFYAPLGDSLIQAARNAEDVIPDAPSQIHDQPDSDSSIQERTHILHRAATLLDKMGQALKNESEGEQVDHGEKQVEKYWFDLKTDFLEQVDRLVLLEALK